MTPAMIRDVGPAKWRCDVASNKTTETTYTEPSTQVQRGLNLGSTMPWKENFTDEERAVVEAGDRETPERRKRDDEDEKYEVVVDGHPFDVSRLARRAQRLCASGDVPSSDGRTRPAADGPRGGSSAPAIELAADYEGEGVTTRNDVRTMMPPEPDWDQREFAINPN